MTGFGFGTRSGLHRLGAPSDEARIVISALEISESAQPGATVGALSVVGRSGFHTFSIPEGGDPDGKFALVGPNLTTTDGLDFEAASSHLVTVEADNGQDPALTRTLLVSVVNTFEEAELAPLSLASLATQGSVLPITGTTNGSSISGLVLPSGWALANGNHDISIAPDAPLGTQDWSFIETLPDSPNSPRVSSGSTTIEAAQTLGPLTLSSAHVSESSTQGEFVGALQGAVGGSQLSLLDNAGGRFAVVNDGVVRAQTGLDFEGNTSHQITVRETLATAANSPRDTVLTISVTNAFEQPDLGLLGLAGTVSQGSVIAISGATSGSTIVGGLLPQGWSVDGPNRQIQITNDAALGVQHWSLIETLDDSSNSPRVTTGSSIVEAAASGSFDPTTAGYVMFDSRDVVADGSVTSWPARDGRTTVSSETVSERPSKNASVISFDGTDDILSDTRRSLGAPKESFNLDLVWNASPLGDAEQFTNTGITRAPDGTWWVVNHPAGSPTRADGILVHFSADFSTILGTIDLAAVYGIGVAGGPQGLVYDLADHTLWFTTALQDEVRNISLDGTPNPSKSIAFPNPAGLAIDHANGTLIILESEGSAANKNAGIMRTVNKADGSTVSSGLLTDMPNWDHVFFDQDKRALFVTGGYEYSGGGDTHIGIYNMDGGDYLQQIAYFREPFATAIEGLYFGDGTLWICNDSGFHGGLGSGLNEILEYEASQIFGDRIVFAAALRA